MIRFSSSAKLGFSSFIFSTSFVYYVIIVQFLLHELCYTFGLFLNFFQFS